MVRAEHATDLLALTAWQMLYGTLPLVALLAVVHGHVNPTPLFGLLILYIAVPGTALGWLLWMFILSRLPAGVAGVASLLTPVIGVLSAWLQLGERPGALEMAGIVFVVAALLVNMLPSLMEALESGSDRERLGSRS
jgi:drug/metabolite transporter (DMT)-like permease